MRLPRSAVFTLGLTLALVAPAIAVAQAGSTSPPGPSPSSIVGGRNATETYSFMVSLQRNGGGGHFCGGALIKADWVATALHCVQGQDPKLMLAHIGTTTLDGGTVTGLSRIVKGEGDFALVQLDSSVKERPAGVPTEAGPIGTRSRILGWGQTCPLRGCSGPAPILQELDTSIVPDAGCESIETGTEICTENPSGNAGACYGDSGGPQIRGTSGNWFLIGTTSRAGNSSDFCATAPSIYNNVAAFRDWIISVVGPLDGRPNPT